MHTVNIEANCRFIWIADFDVRITIDGAITVSESISTDVTSSGNWCGNISGESIGNNTNNSNNIAIASKD